MTSANSGEAPSAALEVAGDSHRIARASGEIPALAREHLGRELRSFYGAVLIEEQPGRLLQLIVNRAGFSGRPQLLRGWSHDEANPTLFP